MTKKALQHIDFTKDTTPKKAVMASFSNDGTLIYCTFDNATLSLYDSAVRYLPQVNHISMYVCMTELRLLSSVGLPLPLQSSLSGEAYKPSSPSYRPSDCLRGCGR